MFLRSLIFSLVFCKDTTEVSQLIENLIKYNLVELSLGVKAALTLISM